MLNATRAINRTSVVTCVLALGAAAFLLTSCAEPAHDGSESREVSQTETARTSQVGHDASVIGSGQPVLVDLGSDTCVPCKMMEPILEELATELDGRLHVVFINTREDRGAAELFGISIIPTQIFFDGEGEELFRHQGFLSREDILAKWSEFGYAFGDAGGNDPGGASGEE